MWDEMTSTTTTTSTATASKLVPRQGSVVVC